MGCDENLRNMINPYTATGTFGVSWNGGFHPDDSLEYVRPDDNIVKPSAEDSFIPPMYITPSNVYLKTQEARRDDIMVGGIPKRIYEDRDCSDPYNSLSTYAPDNTAPQIMSGGQAGVGGIWMDVLRLYLPYIILIIIIFLIFLKKK